MKKIVKLILLLLTLGILSSCGADDGAAPGDDAPAEDSGDNFIMKGTVTNIADRIEIEVYEAEYAEGIYWLVTDSKTKVLDENGNNIPLSDIKAGDKITVEFSGQVMMSYPPQVYAIKIKRQ